MPPTDSPGDRRRNVMLYCHHSTGLGHLVRSLAVAEAMAGEWRVTLCCGGRLPDGVRVPAGVEVVALPPISAAPDGRLVGDRESLAATLQLRTALLAERFDRLEPDVLLIELFPFGRRKFAPELVPLLERARGAPRPPLVVCSVRDLLVTGHPDKTSHDDEAARRLDAYFDAVVVHGDPRLARLEETFRPTVPSRVPVHYSGYVVAGARGRWTATATATATSTARARATPPSRAPRRRREVVVSAGGGLVGGALLRAAADAHADHLGDAGMRTRIVTGPFLPDADVAALVRLARRTSGLTVERFVPDLRAVLAGAAVSVSQCGYNTMLDVLVTQTPAVVVPYGDDRENEQPERARRLARLGAVDVIAPGDLDARRLAEHVVGLVEHPRPRPPLDIDGAHRTASIVSSLLDRQKAVA